MDIQYELGPFPRAIMAAPPVARGAHVLEVLAREVGDVPARELAWAWALEPFWRRPVYSVWRIANEIYRAVSE